MVCALSAFMHLVLHAEPAHAHLWSNINYWPAQCYGNSHCWADFHLMAQLLLTCRMLEVTTPGQEDRLKVDFAEVYRNSQLAK